MGFNPYGYQLKIDMLKGENLYKSLIPENQKIDKVSKNFEFHSDGYDVNKNQSSWWFDPKNTNRLPSSIAYPYVTAIQKHSFLKLYLYYSNYFSLMLIDALYSEKKDILIEEQAGGRGDLLVYLKALGFSNFHMIDNFTQLPKSLYENMMKEINVQPKLNDFSCVPIVLNLVGLPYFIKPINKETELVVTYDNQSLIGKGEGENYHYKDDGHEKNTVMENKVWLATESHGAANAYCNKDKVEEFTEKLRKYEVK